MEFAFLQLFTIILYFHCFNLLKQNNTIRIETELLHKERSSEIEKEKYVCNIIVQRPN